MSWRTQGHYVGLGVAEKEWLSGFDREWDTKAQGRSQIDALESPIAADDGIFKFLSVDPVTSTRAELEANLLTLARQVARFTVPKALKRGWTIHLIMRCGKRVRARFDDEAQAAQAYYALEELSFWFPRT